VLGGEEEKKTTGGRKRRPGKGGGTREEGESQDAVKMKKMARLRDRGRSELKQQKRRKKGPEERK